MTSDRANEEQGDREPRISADAQRPPFFHFWQLAQGAQEVLVEHQGCVYRLRLTRNGKLILNK